MSKLHVDELRNEAGTEQVLVEKLAQLEARMSLIDDKQFATAWVNFDSNTGIIRDSFNISSIDVTTVSVPIVTFTTPMDNLDYLISPSGKAQSNLAGSFVFEGSSGKELSKFDLFISNSTGTVAGNTDVHVLIFGGKN